MMHRKWLVILDTMWGSKGRAIRYFKINPLNKSGKILYTIFGKIPFLVTNVCQFAVSSPHEHGEPNLEWTRNNIYAHEWEGILVCGNVARDVVSQMSLPNVPTMFTKHPASRNFTLRERFVITKFIHRGDL